MKLVLTAMLALGAAAFAAPASAQLVNGLSGPNYHGEAPIGTKAGGSPSSLKAPGEATALAAALRNERDARILQPKFIHARMIQTERRKVARAIPRVRVGTDSAERLRTSSE